AISIRAISIRAIPSSVIPIVCCNLPSLSYSCRTMLITALSVMNEQVLSVMNEQALSSVYD
ncbi:MAG: hypothetical protein KUG75_11560, partial [Pseudomonadales bacterium]|nr:hypothetical protein [Pseudomonadales bacterium]